MSKPEWFGFAVLGCGAIFGFVMGGPFGLALATVCLVVGLVLLVASEALGTKQKPDDPQASYPQQPKTQIVVLVKEVHARPERRGKFQEVHAPDETDLEFEVFVHCWLVNDTDQHLGIKDARLFLSKDDGATPILEQVIHDLDSWHLGKLKDELDSWGVRYLHAAEEPMSAFNTTEPLEGGDTREGWLHFRIQNITPAELRNACIQLSVTDSHGATHVGTARGPHHVPGRVWPFHPESGPATFGVGTPRREDAPRIDNQTPLPGRPST